MIFRQLIHDNLSCASYLIGDEDAGVAAVVDPKFEIEEDLALARYMGVRIEHLLETHNHADHVSGHGRLTAATGATTHIHRLAAPDHPGAPHARAPARAHRLRADRHRPRPEPWAVLSGDTTVRQRHSLRDGET